MPVQPFSFTAIQDAKALYEYLVVCQSAMAPGRQIDCMSLSLPLPKIDPLTALEQFGHPSHFYWEHPIEQIAIAAAPPLRSLPSGQGSRFVQAQAFVQQTLNRTAVVGDLARRFSGPHFFCSFTFNGNLDPATALFPAAHIFLPEWHVACDRNAGVLTVNLHLPHLGSLANRSDQIWHLWQKLQHGQQRVGSWQTPAPALSSTFPPQWTAPAPTPFLGAVETALTAIRQQTLEKLVLADTLEVTTRSPVSLTQSLNLLRQRYVNCQIFSIQANPGLQFIGASPEHLIQVQNRRLSSDVLAGSAPRGLTSQADRRLGHQLLNSQKDRHEHQIVLTFMAQQLRGLGLMPHHGAVPHLLQLPNIQHLRTLVTATLPPDLSLFTVLEMLHPTPAVAGTPRTIAQHYLHRLEHFDRQLYAAPLGWVDHQGNGIFTVGIRSALIQEQRLRLYAGAGIVAGSNPQKEWAEVQLKLRTLLQSLVLAEAVALHR